MPRYAEQEAREAVRASWSYAEALRKLGLRPSGGNHRLFRRYVDLIWRIPTDHFDPHRARLAGLGRVPVPLAEVLVEGSSYNRGRLMGRLIEAGLKPAARELCGQTEMWRGRRMALILDHVNGVPDDNRIENLRIVCPNCAATFETHCGREDLRVEECACSRCGSRFLPRRAAQRYCSTACGIRHANRRRQPRPEARKVERPSYEELLKETASMSLCAVGRKYGVSDNAVRKWLRWYRAQAEAAKGDPG